MGACIENIFELTKKTLKNLLNITELYCFFHEYFKALFTISISSYIKSFSVFFSNLYAYKMLILFSMFFFIGTLVNFQSLRYFEHELGNYMYIYLKSIEFWS